ncbi:type II secretion system protein [Oxalobacteraceae bacterium OM1]|nr:type II secretion system protein [Oxalobacteraceae bacterium OM1]
MFTSRARQAGITFIELIMFIVIVGVGVAGILKVIQMSTAKSADPVVRKQAIAIAESLLEEVELQPFTYCDPDDPNQNPDAPSPSCTTGYSESATLGPETQGGVTETRYYVNATTPMFDNVNDYAGFSMTGIKPIDDQLNAIPGLASYNATVSISQISAGEATGFNIPAANVDAVLKITVRVTGPIGTDISMTGYRFRYAPFAF